MCIRDSPAADALQDLRLALAEQAVAGLAGQRCLLAMRGADHRLAGAWVEAPLLGFIQQYAGGLLIAEGSAPGALATQRQPDQRGAQQSVFGTQGITTERAEIAAAIQAFVSMRGQLSGFAQAADLATGAVRPVRHQACLLYTSRCV